MCGKCSDSRPGAPASAAPAVSEATVQPIRATIEPGFDAKVSIRIVPGRDPFTIPVQPSCAPRGDRPFNVRPHPFSDDLVIKLTEANATVSAWLAKDDANAKAFLDDPVTALGQAGVELTRAEAKAVSRSHAVVREDAVLPPGGRISTMEVTAVKRGKVGDRRPTERPTDKPGEKPTDMPTDKPGSAGGGCGC